MLHDDPRRDPGVYDVCMARLNVYVPDELAAAAREAGLNVSALTQRAIDEALAAQRTSTWLARFVDEPSSVSHEAVLDAIDATRDELGA